MNTTFILALVVALVPLLGNLAVLGLRRAGYNVAADWVVRLLPLIIVTASSKSREEALERLIEEVAKLTHPEAEPAKLAAAEVASAPMPASSAKSIPPMVGGLLLVFLVGCTPSGELSPAGAKVVDTSVDAGLKIAGAICEGYGKSGAFARFVCKMVDVAAGSIGPTAAGAPPPFARDARPFEVLVPEAQAEAFARANGAAQ